VKKRQNELMTALIRLANESIVSIAIDRQENVRVTVPLEFLDSSFQLVKHFIVGSNCKSLWLGITRTFSRHWACLDGQ
jgi:hypothetical protein